MIGVKHAPQSIMLSLAYMLVIFLPCSMGFAEPVHMSISLIPLCNTPKRWQPCCKYDLAWNFHGKLVVRSTSDTRMKLSYLDIIVLLMSSNA